MFSRFDVYWTQTDKQYRIFLYKWNQGKILFLLWWLIIRHFGIELGRFVQVVLTSIGYKQTDSIGYSYINGIRERNCSYSGDWSYFTNLYPGPGHIINISSSSWLKNRILLINMKYEILKAHRNLYSNINHITICGGGGRRVFPPPPWCFLNNFQTAYIRMLKRKKLDLLDLGFLPRFD